MKRVFESKKFEFDARVNALADLRVEVRLKERLVMEKEDELRKLAPKLFDEIGTARLALVTLRKTAAADGATIRDLAQANPDIAAGIPWLTPRFKTVVDVAERFAIRLALMFCPGAVKLNRPTFDKWAKAHEDNPLLVGVSIDKVPAYVIRSDLSKYESEPVSLDEPPDKLKE